MPAQEILRMSPSGPQIGAPPVRFPQLANLVLDVSGSSAELNFDTATPTIRVNPTFQYMGGGGVAASDLPCSLKVGYRYCVDLRVCLKTASTSQSRVFFAKWNQRVKATGLWVSSDAAAGYINTPAAFAHGIADNVSAQTYSTSIIHAFAFVPSQEYDMVRFIIEDPLGTGQDDFSVYCPNCSAQIWELAGT